jgi:hypothetical protein
MPSSARAAALVAAVAACTPFATTESGAVLDGLPCGTPGAGALVFIEVDYDASGLPRVDPVECEVPRGAQVTWRGPRGTPVPFEIVFKAANPLPRERQGLPSRAAGDRQRVRRSLDAPPGRYAYSVRANGRELDPAIIIR